MTTDVVLLSGGIDSTTVLGMAVKARDDVEPDTVLALSIFYGQRHSAELKAAKEVADFFGVRHMELALSLPMGDSVLMDPDAEMPHMTYQELEASEGVSPTYVPFRNGNMISRAVAQALQEGAERVWVGVHAEDARGWAYPDCTPEFIGAMANAVYVGTYHKVRLLAPLQYLLKAQVIAAGIKLGIYGAYALTRSCYENQETPCGECPTCVARAAAFEANLVQDPAVRHVA